MSAGALKCSVCGRPMNLIKVLPRSLGHLTRYECMCGHCEPMRDAPGLVRSDGRFTFLKDLTIFLVSLSPSFATEPPWRNGWSWKRRLWAKAKCPPFSECQPP